MLILDLEEMQAVQRDTILKLYLKQTNTILMEEEEYKEKIRETNEAISDREILGKEIVERLNTLRRYENEKEEWSEKIERMKEEIVEIKERGEILKKKRRRVEKEKEKVEKLIKRAKEAVN